MKKQLIKYGIYFLVVIVIAVMTVMLIAKEDFGEIVHLLKSVDVNILILMMMLMLLIYTLEGLILRTFARLCKPNYRWKQGTYNGLIGVFMNAITPSATGGQFVQAYTFNKQGVPFTKSPSILLMHFITFQVTMVLFCLVALILRFNTAYGSVKWNGFDIITLSLIGFAINTAVIGGLYFVAYSRLFHRFITKTLVNFLAFFRIIRKKDKLREKLNKTIVNFKKEASELHKNYRLLITTIFLNFLKLLLLYSIPFFALRAIGFPIPSSEIITIICFTSFVYLITCFIPIPGASGGAEVMFFVFFSYFIHSSDDQAQVKAAMLLWRLVTFYLGVIIGGLTFFFYRESGKKEIAQFYETSKIEKVTLTDGLPTVHFHPSEEGSNPDSPTDRQNS